MFLVGYNTETCVYVLFVLVANQEVSVYEGINAWRILLLFIKMAF